MLAIGMLIGTSVMWLLFRLRLAIREEYRRDALNLACTVAGCESEHWCLGCKRDAAKLREKLTGEAMEPVLNGPGEEPSGVASLQAYIETLHKHVVRCETCGGLEPRAYSHQTKCYGCSLPIERAADCNACGQPAPWFLSKPWFGRNADAPELFCSVCGCVVPKGEGPYRSERFPNDGLCHACAHGSWNCDCCGARYANDVNRCASCDEHDAWAEATPMANIDDDELRNVECDVCGHCSAWAKDSSPRLCSWCAAGVIATPESRLVEA